MMNETKEVAEIKSKYVRYATGAKLYGMCEKTFSNLARKANARHKVGKIVLVNTELVDMYLETCRLDEDEYYY